MATVTSQLTRINDVEGTLTNVSIGGGPGATANTDIFIQGAQSLARRLSNVTLSGFLLDDGASNNLSAADVHIGVWLWVTHYAVLTALRVRVASNSGSGNYDEHIVPLTEYPALGGWIRVWIDISRTPDTTGGTALDEATARYFGPVVSIPSVGGNAQNVVLDAIDHTTTGLLLAGTSGLFTDFVTADSNTTNQYGVVESRSEIIFCRARLTLGSSSSLVFDDSGFVIVFPQQNLVADTFMGITCDLQNASTDITLSSGSLQSPGVKKGDFVVTSTSGTLTVSACSFSGLRIVTLTSACSFSGTTFQGCGLVTGAGAELLGCVFNGSTATSALLWDTNVDTNGKLDDSEFISGGTGHAIEFGTSAPSSISFSNLSFTGYGANSTINAAVYVNRSSGTFTINILGGASPTYRTAGATVVINISYALTLTDIPSGVVVTIVNSSTRTELFNTTSTGTSITYTHAGGETVDILLMSNAYDPNLSDIYDLTLPSQDSTIKFQLIADLNYVNP